MYKAKALKYVITRLPINDNLIEASTKEDIVFTENENDTIQTDTKENKNELDKTIVIQPQVQTDTQEKPQEKPQEKEKDSKAKLIAELIKQKIPRSKALKAVEPLKENDIQKLLDDNDSFINFVFDLQSEEIPV